VALDVKMTMGHVEYLITCYRAHYGLCGSPRDDQRLFGLLGKQEYVEALESDLLEIYRLDLTEEWQERRWGRLLNLADRISKTRTSWLNEVMCQDEELAELMVKTEKRDAPPKPSRSMRDYSPIVEVLSTIADRQGELAQVMAATKGAKPRRVDPLPRPSTAYARIRQRKSREHHSYTVARVYGYIDAQGKPTGVEPKTGVVLPDA
jgi:hypothetical protein